MVKGKFYAMSFILFRKINHSGGQVPNLQQLTYKIKLKRYKLYAAHISGIMGIGNLRVLVYRVVRKRPPVPHLAEKWKTNDILDDWLF